MDHLSAAVGVNKSTYPKVLGKLHGSMNRSLKWTNLSKGILRFGLSGICAALLCASPGFSSSISATEPTEQQLLSGQPLIYKLTPERKDGRGYKLIYMVDAPLDVFWKFKTDFDNQFLLSNKLIISHRFVSRNHNAVVTENEYSNKPKAVFRWQTTLLPDQHRLKFILLNPEDCAQKYHYGYIQMEAFGQKTKVTQVAYFDFFGVSIWVSYPFYGGMSYFLKYTAGWEQQTILKLKNKYEE